MFWVQNRVKIPHTIRLVNTWKDMEGKKRTSWLKLFVADVVFAPSTNALVVVVVVTMTMVWLIDNGHVFTKI